MEILRIYPAKMNNNSLVFRFLGQNRKLSLMLRSLDSDCAIKEGRIRKPFQILFSGNNFIEFIEEKKISP